MTKVEQKQMAERRRAWILARLQMVAEVKAELRAKGVKIEYVKRGDIVRLAEARLAVARPVA